eukprot:m.132531 g.132531  ORF g.132531 m.132531 type:complete len:517 (-) comp16850_c0_seq1:109-1659(-)
MPSTQASKLGKVTDALTFMLRMPVWAVCVGGSVKLRVLPGVSEIAVKSEPTRACATRHHTPQTPPMMTAAGGVAAWRLGVRLAEGVSATGAAKVVQAAVDAGLGHIVLPVSLSRGAMAAVGATVCKANTTRCNTGDARRIAVSVQLPVHMGEGTGGGVLGEGVDAVARVLRDVHSNIYAEQQRGEAKGELHACLLPPPSASDFGSATAHLHSWRQVEHALGLGLVACGGCTDLSPSQLDSLWNVCSTPPAIVQAELHPMFPQEDLREFCGDRGATLLAHSVYGGRARPAKEVQPREPSLFETPTLVRVATNLKVDPPAVVLAWVLAQDNTAAAPLCSKPEHVANNAEVLSMEPFDDRHQRMMRVLARNRFRFNKGLTRVDESDGAHWAHLWDETPLSARGVPLPGYALCNTAEVNPSIGLSFDKHSTANRVMVVRVNDTEVAAYINRCPHTNVALDWFAGQFLSSDSSEIVCSAHDARFRLEDGLCTSGPCLGESLIPVPTYVDSDGTVRVAPRPQ